MTFNSIRSRNWCFTINNPTNEWTKELQALTNHIEFRYVVCQLERGEKGTPHLQGYIQFNKQFRGSAIKKLHKTAHWEAAKGSLEDNNNYCTKLETRIEGPFKLGLPKQAGRRTDIEEAITRAEDGEAIEMIIHDMPGLARIDRCLIRQQNRWLAKDDRPKDMQVICYWGDAGSGKTYEILAKGDVYQPRKGVSGWWWDGYKGEKRILFDDFYGTLPYCQFLKLTDKNQQFWGDIKGESPIKIQADEYYFTSNKHPMMWYSCNSFDATAFRRRFTHIQQWRRQGNWDPISTLETVRHVKSDFTSTTEDSDMMCTQNGKLMSVGDRPIYGPLLDKTGFVFAEDMNSH